MRKEFKFVRGLYTDKELFDNDIVGDSFVILDKMGEPVSFEAKDDSKAQSQLIKASEERVCKLYTITPDKITMKGDLVKGDPSSYKFTPKIIESLDDGEIIPPNVITKACETLDLTAKYNLDVQNIGIGEDNDPVSIEVTFEDKNGKSFKRSMMFKATGSVDRRSLVSVGDVTGADLNKNEVYYLKDNKYERLTDINNNEVFRNGRKQEKVQVAEVTFPAHTIKLEIINNEAVASEPAHYYEAPNDYKFAYNDNYTIEAGDLINAVAAGNSHLIPATDKGELLNMLPFILPSTDNCVFLPSALHKYIIESDTFKEITFPDNNYPYGKKQALYDNNYYYAYDGYAYKDSSTDANVYLKLSDSESKPISSDNVGMTNIYTAVPLFNLDKEHPYTMAIKEDTFKITATEV